MTDPADRFLEERLHALARGVSVPVVSPDADVRRGRRRLFRMRVAMAGATTGTLAVVLGITSLTAGDPKATEPPPVTQPPTTLPATPSSSPSDDSSDDATPDGDDQDRRSDLQVGNQPGSDLDSQGTEDAGRGGRPDGGSVSGAASSAATGGTQGGTDFGHASDGAPASDPAQTPAATATATSSPAQTPTATPTETPTSEPSATPTSTPTLPPTGSAKVRVHRVLRYYNDVLAEHLDPARNHLLPYDRTIDTRRATRRDGVLFALGASYRWEASGSLTGLQVAVASGWDQVEWDCGASYSDWVCHAGDSEDTEFAEHDGVVQVAVEHASGQVVVLTADPTREAGRGSGAGHAEADLAAAAADDRLILPGIAPVAPPTIDEASFAAAGVAALMRPGDTFAQTGIDRAPWVRGDWTGKGGERGTLTWTLEPLYSQGRFTCLTTYRSCSEVAIDDLGTTVHVALLKKKAGGGWLIRYDGGTYGATLYSSNRTFPKKRAYAFLTDRSWQPVR